mmetsp:Transcript_11792/g.31832  ORF Transcript_11792/g.31832 Transcript_11792/m.31832 type:complete len:277 (-) Transcript_11792:6696-7526(-)
MKQDADHTRKTAAVDMELGLPCRVRCARRARFAPVVCAWRAWSRWESANAGAHCVRRMVWCVCRSAERASGGASTRRCHHPLRRRAPHSPPGPCRTRLERQRRSGFDFAGHMTATCWRPRRSVPRTSSKRRRSLRTAGRTLLTAGRSPGFGPGSQPIAGHTLRTAGRTRLTAGRSPGFGPGSQPIAGRTLRTAERIPRRMHAESETGQAVCVGGWGMGAYRRFRRRAHLALLRIALALVRIALRLLGVYLYTGAAGARAHSGVSEGGGRHLRTVRA